MMMISILSAYLLVGGGFCAGTGSMRCRVQMRFMTEEMYENLTPWLVNCDKYVELPAMVLRSAPELRIQFNEGVAFPVEPEVWGSRHVHVTSPTNPADYFDPEFSIVPSDEPAPAGHQCQVGDQQQTTKTTTVSVWDEVNVASKPSIKFRFRAINVRPDLELLPSQRLFPVSGNLERQGYETLTVEFSQQHRLVLYWHVIKGSMGMIRMGVPEMAMWSSFPVPVLMNNLSVGPAKLFHVEADRREGGPYYFPRWLFPGENKFTGVWVKSQVPDELLMHAARLEKLGDDKMTVQLLNKWLESLYIMTSEIVVEVSIENDAATFQLIGDRLFEEFRDHFRVNRFDIRPEIPRQLNLCNSVYRSGGQKDQDIVGIYALTGDFTRLLVDANLSCRSGGSDTPRLEETVVVRKSGRSEISLEIYQFRMSQIPTHSVVTLDGMEVQVAKTTGVSSSFKQVQFQFSLAHQISHIWLDARYWGTGDFRVLRGDIVSFNLPDDMAVGPDHIITLVVHDAFLDAHILYEVKIQDLPQAVLDQSQPLGHSSMWALIGNVLLRVSVLALIFATVVFPCEFAKVRALFASLSPTASLDASSASVELQFPPPTVAVPSGVTSASRSEFPKRRSTTRRSVGLDAQAAVAAAASAVSTEDSTASAAVASVEDAIAASLALNYRPVVAKAPPPTAPAATSVASAGGKKRSSVQQGVRQAEKPKAMTAAYANLIKDITNVSNEHSAECEVPSMREISDNIFDSSLFFSPTVNQLAAAQVAQPAIAPAPVTVPEELELPPEVLEALAALLLRLNDEFAPATPPQGTAHASAGIPPYFL